MLIPILFKNNSSGYSYLRINQVLILFQLRIRITHSIYQCHTLLRIRIVQGIASVFDWKWEALEYWCIVESSAVFELHFQHHNYRYAAVRSKLCRCFLKMLQFSAIWTFIMSIIQLHQGLAEQATVSGSKIMLQNFTQSFLAASY